MFMQPAANPTTQKEKIMFTHRIAIFIAALMFTASVGAMVARPTTKVADERPPISLATMIPKQFGDWREAPLRYAQVVNPQAQELLDKLYTEVLSRTYVNSDGYYIMLSLAYGSDQRGALQAHKPEVCYPAQGFTLQKKRRRSARHRPWRHSRAPPVRQPARTRRADYVLVHRR